MTRTRIALATFLVAVLLAANVSAQVPAMTTLRRAGDAGGCTTFSMALNGSAWVTANHCVAGVEKLYIGGRPAAVKAVDPRYDMAILTGPASDRYYRIGSAPVIGDPISTYGYAVSPNGRNFVPYPMLFNGIVASPYIPNYSSYWGDLMLLTSVGSAGHSGAPVIDSRGDVVGIVVGGTDGRKTAHLSFSLTYSHFTWVAVTGMQHINRYGTPNP